MLKMVSSCGVFVVISDAENQTNTTGMLCCFLLFQLRCPNVRILTAHSTANSQHSTQQRAERHSSFNYRFKLFSGGLEAVSFTVHNKKVGYILLSSTHNCSICIEKWHPRRRKKRRWRRLLLRKQNMTQWIWKCCAKLCQCFGNNLINQCLIAIMSNLRE
jgi:hypothetical protein